MSLATAMNENEEGGASPSESPRIIMRYPQEGAKVTPPFDIYVEFVPSRDAAIEVTSLRVYFRTLWDIDITRSVRPYTTPAGIRMSNVTFPPGRHTVMLTIADKKGNKVSHTMTVHIARGDADDV